ncbi:MAG: hypothetical protein IPH94_11260 [Saprospiraceae bacterium]|nr:hypothetical protein [Saprospiraceae bacterium]
MNDFIVIWFIHFAIPVFGIFIFIKLLIKMKKEAIPDAPVVQLFLLFGNYGVLLILILTSVMWKWSGMASIGAFGTVTIGPILAGICAFSVYKNRKLTRYHKLTYKLSIGYLGFVLLLILSSLIYSGTK